VSPSIIPNNPAERSAVKAVRFGVESQLTSPVKERSIELAAATATLTAFARSGWTLGSLF